MGKTFRLRQIALPTLMAVATLLIPAFTPTHAEDPIKTSLDASEARDFLGVWAVEMDMMGRKMNFTMTVVDLDGKAGASFDSDRQAEAVAVEEMEMLEDGSLKLMYDMPFGSQTFKLAVVAELTDDGLEGLISEASGLFEAPFTATEAFDDPETRVQRRRNREIAATAANLRFEQDKIRITFAPLTTESKDFEHFQNLADGEVFEYVGGRAAKLLTDIDMHFGDTIIKKGNAHETYPGVYSIWLKKVGDGWKLVFNEEADVWGTMYNPEVTVAEVDAVETAAEEVADTHRITMEKGDSEDIGKIIIHWADKQYVAEFKVELPTESAS